MIVMKSHTRSLWTWAMRAAGGRYLSHLHADRRGAAAANTRDVRIRASVPCLAALLGLDMVGTRPHMAQRYCIRVVH